ncbi:MAG TPA: EAL domain-containing protein [Usitatibacter sp.]|nr:EAL domain-containing protein [Usitatibacter sp.]
MTAAEGRARRVRRVVLIADDEATTRHLTRASLESAGFSVVEATDGEEAVATYAKSTPDLVILDVQMPRMDGISVCRALRAREDGRHVPIVMATGMDDVESIDAAYAAGATDFVAKPLNWALLPHRMRYVLRSSDAARELGKSEEKFRLITESSSDFVALLDRAGRRLYTSPSYGTLFPGDLKGTDSFREIHPADRKAIGEIFRETVETGIGREARFRWLMDDGEVRYIESRGNVILDDAGKVSRVVVVSRDVTERTRQEERIQRLSRITAMLSNINSAIVRIRERPQLLEEACRIAVEHGHFSFAWVGWVHGPTGTIAPVARAGDDKGFLDQLRLSARADVPEGQSLAGHVVRGGRPVIVNDVAGGSGGLMRRGPEFLARGFRAIMGLPLTVGGETAGLLVLYSSAAGFFDDAEMRLLEELAGDISFGLEHIEKEREVHHLAYYDPLTGLPNRRLFQETLATLTDASRRGDEKLVVIVIDVRGFHVLNDNLGRHAGDALLKLVAQKVRSGLSPSDVLGRIGGDQFGVILTDIAHDSQIAGAVARIFGALDGAFDIGGQPLRILVKGGASVFPTPTDGATADALLTNAESALKKAKASPEAMCFYAPQLNAAIANRVALENALARALEASEFRLLYQPIVNLRTGLTTGLEALLYWNDGGKGLVPPVRFIPTLEDTGMILPVGSWVVRQAMEDLHRLRRGGFDGLRVAVNVSPLQFRQRDFPAYLAASSARSIEGLDIEITESVMMEDIEACIAMLWKLRGMGIGVAVDDFGTGFSSLSYVARLPATTIKVDKSFVDDMAASAGRRAVVSTVISLAHALDMNVVAEGVETEPQAAILRELGCDEMQGFLHSRPMPIEEIEALLKPVAATVIA